MAKFWRDHYLVHVEYPHVVRMESGPLSDYRISVRKLTISTFFEWPEYVHVMPEVETRADGRCRLRGKLRRRGFFHPTIDPPAEIQLAALVDDAIAQAESAIERAAQERASEKELDRALQRELRGGSR